MRTTGLSVYDQRIREAIADLRQEFGLGKVEPGLWQEVKFQYLGLLYRHRQPELAETFYNSVFVGLFERHYYNNDNIFVRPAVSTERIEGEIYVDALVSEPDDVANLFLEKADERNARLAMREYGDALREIAVSGIFPGDLLLKSFGVTRHCRVIFYDYDEIVPIGQCNFRQVPEPMTPEQEMAAEPWYSVAENDIVPEEFATFLMSDPGWRRLFYQEHAELLSAENWRQWQTDAARDRSPDLYPYRREIRFRRSGGESR